MDRRKFLLFALSSLLIPLASNFRTKGTHNRRVRKIEEPDFINRIRSNFRLQYELFTKSSLREGKYAYNDGRYEVTFTVDPEFQEEMKNIFKVFKVKYGAFVALDPKSGEVLAAISSTDYPNLLFKNNFPTASTFKIVTAVAALDANLATPQTTLVCGGLGNSCSPYVWLNSKLQIKRRFSEAFATSANPFFGNLGRLIGKELLLEYAKRFGFNRKDYGFPWGRIIEPKGDYEIALTAAGLGKTTSSPFHEVLMAQAILNRGIMLKPTLVEEIVDLKTGKSYRFKPAPLIKVMKPNTAKEIREMMLLTPRIGTISDRKYFKIANRIKGLEIGGKTGTLTEWNYPEGRCEWFTGFISYKGKEVAVASVAVNGRRFYISGYEISALAAIRFAKLYEKRKEEERLCACSAK